MRSEGVSVVVPVYEEAATVGPLAQKLAETLKNREFELIFVDDGSGASTAHAIKETAAHFPFVRVLSLPRHQGKGAALLAGFSQCRHNIVVTLDGDLQNPPEEIPRLLEALHDADFVVGWRRRRFDPWHKRLQGLLFNAVLRLLGSPVHDANCGLRAFKREVLAHPLCSTSRYRIMAPLAKMAGFKVAEVEVRHDRRRHGRSKFGFLRIFAAAVDCALLLLLHLNRRRKPLQAAAGVATAAALTLLLAQPYLVAPAMGLAAVALVLWAIGAAQQNAILAPFRKEHLIHAPCSERAGG